jgi:type IV pilus assembly protein PilE
MRVTRSGFTLTEIMIVVVIMAVMAGVAGPAYFQTVERSRSNEALATLNIIHMGQKIYRLNNPTFWNGGANAAPAAINANLGVDISPTFYTDIDFAGVGANGYTCRATRNNVQGGNPAWFVQYVWNDVNDTLQVNRNP